MKLITKHTDYAVRALMRLAESPGVFVSTRAIARKERIPGQFLKSIMRKLIAEGIVAAREGASGGVTLARKPGAVNLGGLVDILQGGLGLSECRTRNKACVNRPRCVLRRRIQGIEKTLAGRLRAVTIEGLMKEREREK